MTITLALTWWDLLWATPASLALLFYGYVFTMSVKERFKELSRIAQWVSIPAVVLSYLLDVLLNVVLLSILFVEVPQEVTITHRMRRWQGTAATHPRRARLAASICRILNLFDPGHC